MWQPLTPETAPEIQCVSDALRIHGSATPHYLDRWRTFTDPIASKNKKYMTTPRSMTTRIDRELAADDRTLDARSWTQTETLMRFPMSTSSVRKAPRPDGSGECGPVPPPGSSGSSSPSTEAAASVAAVVARGLSWGAGWTRAADPGHRHAGSSRHSDDAVRGSAAKTTPSASTTATSSSCEIPLSLAPSSSSRAIAKEMVKARSDPSPARALDASLMAVDHRSAYLRARVVERREISVALAEGAPIAPVRAWQGAQPLVLRLLYVAPRGAAVHCALPARNACAGAIFGCSLANLVHFAGGRKHALRAALRALHGALEPAAAAVPTLTGTDAVYLARGFACHCIVRAQTRRMPEVRAARLDTRRAHPGVALGAAAALLVAFSVLAADPADLEADGPLDERGLGAALVAALDTAAVAVATWRLPGDAHPDVRRARDAERRALDRARCAVRYAQHAAARDGAGHARDAAGAFCRQLHALRAAVWPAGAHIAMDTSGALLERIASGVLFEAPALWGELLSSWATAPHPDAGVLPLSALPSAYNLARAGRGEDDDDDDGASRGCSASVPSTFSNGSSLASRSSWGSAGSVAGDGGGGPGSTWSGPPGGADLLDDLRSFAMVDGPPAVVALADDDDGSGASEPSAVPPARGPPAP